MQQVDAVQSFHIYSFASGLLLHRSLLSSVADGAMVEFDRPPVYEAVIGLEFNTLNLGALKLSGLQAVWANEYPSIQEMPALEPSVAIGQPGPIAAFSFSMLPPPLRLWFADPSGHFLIQVQRDRLLLNWRKLNGGEYPRYAALRERFTKVVEQFREYVRVELGGAVVPTAAEFSYINRVPAGLSADEIYTVFKQPLTQLPGEVLFTRFQQVRNISSTEFGAPGQLSISSDPVQDQSGTAIQMAISTKFFPQPTEFSDGTWKLLDGARTISRQTFVALATDEMKAEWGVR
jgi:uncharacterized protein (TIGR04255 family)